MRCYHRNTLSLPAGPFRRTQGGQASRSALPLSFQRGSAMDNMGTAPLVDVGRAGTADLSDRAKRRNQGDLSNRSPASFHLPPGASLLGSSPQSTQLIDWPCAIGGQCRASVDGPAFSIEAVIPAAERPVVEQAVRWFTDTTPEFVPSAEGSDRLLVSAPGYRLGADRGSP